MTNKNLGEPWIYLDPALPLQASTNVGIILPEDRFVIAWWHALLSPDKPICLLTEATWDFSDAGWRITPSESTVAFADKGVAAIKRIHRGYPGVENDPTRHVARSYIYNTHPPTRLEKGLKNDDSEECEPA